LELETLLEKVMEELEKKLGKEGTVQLKEQAKQAVADMAAMPSEDEKTDEPRTLIPSPKWKEGLEELVSSTPARIGVWRAGTRPMTKTMLQLRRDHAAAVDAVYG
ncbi:ethanolamine ammonia-lyase light chain EutC, partial [Microbacteriaceae bacterium K1510]|nr:ethanolamine ammonia-lyase light chain EutC [Microbacteriaceae bacterium K1510]